MNYKDLLSSRNVIVAAVSIAVVGFLLIHNSFGTLGDNPLVLRVMAGEISLTDDCMNNSNDDWYCGAAISYRWLLAAVVMIIAGALIVREKESQ
jgi:hypothetical protein